MRAYIFIRNLDLYDSLRKAFEENGILFNGNYVYSGFYDIDDKTYYSRSYYEVYSSLKEEFPFLEHIDKNYYGTIPEWFKYISNCVDSNKVFLIKDTESISNLLGYIKRKNKFDITNLNIKIL